MSDCPILACPHCGHQLPPHFRRLIPADAVSQPNQSDPTVSVESEVDHRNTAPEDDSRFEEADTSAKADQADDYRQCSGEQLLSQYSSEGLSQYSSEDLSQFDQQMLGLDTLPDIALDIIFEKGDYFTAASLALVCFPCYLAFLRHRSQLSKQACHDLLPECAASLYHSEDGPDLEGDFDIWWGDAFAIYKIYWLANEHGTLETIWSMFWSKLFEQLCCECCHGLVGFTLHPPGDSHADMRVDIMLKSNHMLQLPMAWLYDSFLGAAISSLEKTLGSRFPQVTSSLAVYRPSKVSSAQWLASPSVDPFSAYEVYAEVMDRSHYSIDGGVIPHDHDDWYSRRCRWPGEAQGQLQCRLRAQQMQEVTLLCDSACLWTLLKTRIYERCDRHVV